MTRKRGCTAIILDAVPPIGTRTASGFVDRSDGTGGFESWEAKVYPPHPEGQVFRGWRVANCMSIRQAAERMGVRPVDISDLEFGRSVPRDGWDALYRFLGSREEDSRMKHGSDKNPAAEKPVSFEIPAEQLTPDPETLPEGGFARIYVLEAWGSGGWWPGDTFTPYAYKAAEQLRSLQTRGVRARVVAYVQDSAGQVSGTSSRTTGG